MKKKLFKCAPTDLRGDTPSPGKRCEVIYSVSYEYNGGTIIGDEWYDGYEVPAPLLAPGYTLKGIGVGLQLNCHPPYATAILVKE